MTASFFLRQKFFRNLTDGKCLSTVYSLFFPPNNTACFLPGRAKDLSAPPRIHIDNGEKLQMLQEFGRAKGSRLWSAACGQGNDITKCC